MRSARFKIEKRSWAAGLLLKVLSGASGAAEEELEEVAKTNMSPEETMVNDEDKDVEFDPEQFRIFEFEIN